MAQSNQNSPKNFQKLRLTPLKSGIVVFLLLILVLSTGCTYFPATPKSGCVFCPVTIPVNTSTVDNNITVSIVSSQIVEGHSKFAAWEDDQINISVKNNWDLPVFVNGGCSCVGDHGDQISYVPIAPTLLPAYVPAHGGVTFLYMVIPLNPNSTEKYTITCSIQNVSLQYPT
jgi:hypothetical protein